MTHLQKRQIEQSEIREQIAEILNAEEPDREELGKLTKRSRDLELEVRAATIADGGVKETETKTTDPEARELDDLIKRSSVEDVFQAVIGQRNTDGATRELQQHFEMPGSNYVPLDMLETRATPAPTDTQANQSTIIPAVFPRSASAWLGVDLPSVPAGDAVYVVLDTNDSAGDHDAGASVSETTGSFSSSVLVPRRVQASFEYRKEDAARLPNMDSALRQNLSDALSSGLDEYILTKTDTGLLEFGTDPTAGVVETFGSYRAAIFGAIDGRYADDAGGIRLLVGASTYAHMAGVYRSNNSDDSALDSVARVSGGVRVSGHVPDAASNVQQAVVARGMGYRHAVAPVWQHVEIVFDEVTKAKTGEKILTAVLLANFKVVRTAGYIRKAFKLAA